MKMKMTKGIIIVLFLASILSITSSTATVAHTESDPFVADLIAGGGNEKSAMDVGDVLVWDDGEFLYVKYVIPCTTCWKLTETHLHVADSLEGIPQTKKGNPIPGHFDYKDTFDPGVKWIKYTIPLDSEWDAGDKLYIAAHAVVKMCSCEEETAWAYKAPCNGGDFDGKNWATYVKYIIQDAIPAIPA